MIVRACAAVLGLLLTTVGAAAPAAAAPPACTAPTPSATRPGYLVADPGCNLDGTPFTALPGATAHTGILAGAAYRIEVPAHWNGRLVLYAHGYRGTGTTVFVDDPQLREHYVRTGYAWAASSYATNGYDVGQGVQDSYALIARFREVTGRRPAAVIMTGASMGGHVTAVAIERYPYAFAGAMPYCGVLGDTALFDYFLDAAVTAAALTGVPIGFPQPDRDAWRAQVARMLPALGLTAGAPPRLTTAGRIWSDVVERRSGGERPGFDGAFAYWSAARSLSPLSDLPFLLGLYPGLTAGSASNAGVFYRSTDRAWPTLVEWRLNARVLRVPRTTPDPDPAAVPRIAGRPPVPVLALHDIGDLFVPLAMPQIYAAEAARHGLADRVVIRAIRGVGHCDFTTGELRRGFDDLTLWIRTGRSPGGDAVTDRRAVADPAFGCRYTLRTRPEFTAPACP